MTTPTPPLPEGDLSANDAQGLGILGHGVPMLKMSSKKIKQVVIKLANGMISWGRVDSGGTYKYTLAELSAI
jgi:hypothetical protein